MNEETTTERASRVVRAFTTDGVVEGRLPVAGRLRTLDDLNMPTRFVMLRAPVSLNPDWQLGPGVLSINKDAILFVQELDAGPTTTRQSVGQFRRAALRMRVRQYEVEGFVHVAPGGEPLKRLDQSNHSFVALTTVLVTAPDDHSTAAFLAVNRDHITAAQEVDAGEDESDVGCEGVGVGSDLGA